MRGATGNDYSCCVKNGYALDTAAMIRFVTIRTLCDLQFQDVCIKVQTSWK